MLVLSPDTLTYGEVGRRRLQGDAAALLSCRLVGVAAVGACFRCLGWTLAPSGRCSWWTRRARPGRQRQSPSGAHRPTPHKTSQ